MTPEGEAFYRRAVRILADIEEAEREAAVGATARGRVRVNANVPFGLHYLLPLVPGFLARHPQVSLDIVLTDEVIDLLDERADVAIRVGPMHGSRLVARKLGDSRMVVVAAPAYLDRRGTPVMPADLLRHDRIGFSFARIQNGWPFADSSGAVNIPASGPVLVGDGESARRLALAGAGLARLAMFHVGGDIEAGRLRAVLENFNPGDVEAIHAVFMGAGSRLPARIRAFIDHLAENVLVP